MRIFPRSAFATLAVVVLMGTGAHAQNQIGVNFIRNYAPDEPAMAAGEVAGVAGVAQANWNNIGTILPDNGSPRTNTVTDLLNDLGQTTTVDLSFSAGKIDIFNNPPTTGDQKMMNGYLDTRTSGGITYKPEVIVSGLGTGVFQTYDLYVYYDSKTIANNRTAKYTVNDGLSTQVYFANDTTGVDTFPNTNYVQGQSLVYDPTHTSDTGNYLIFQGLSGSTFSLFVSGVNASGIEDGSAAPLNGFQIIGTAAAIGVVPEPGTALLLASGLLPLAGMALRRQRKG